MPENTVLPEAASPAAATSALRLDGQVAIVTGAGRGLGRSHAIELARRGARVVVNDLDRTPSVAEDTAADIRAFGGQALAVHGSVTDDAAVERLVAQTLAAWGRVDILVNNAGFLRDKSFSKITLEDFQSVIDVHLMGAVRCTKAVWDLMKAQRHGRIVMTTSSSGLFGNFGQSNYSAAKMALVGLMQTLALEGEKYGIRVNALAPSAATQMTESLFSAEELAMLTPHSVSPGLAYLVGPDAPTRTILCAGAGSFACSHITLTAGVHVGVGDDAAERLRARADALADRAGEVVPTTGFQQARREITQAQVHAQAKAKASATAGVAPAMP